MSAPTDGLIPLPVSHSGKQFFRYTCVRCGEDATNSYSEPIASRILASRECFTCDYWQQFAKEYKDYPNLTIIEGRVYSPGNRTTGSFRGMAGRRFDIEYIQPSIHAGKRCTTFDLWSGGKLPDYLREQFPDTAKFLGAEYVLVGETGCWNHTQTKSDPYPLPLSIFRRDK